MSKMATLKRKKTLGLDEGKRRSVLHWCVEVLAPERRVRFILSFTWGPTMKCNNFAIG